MRVGFTRLDRYVIREIAWPACMGVVTYTFLLMMRGIFTLMEQIFVRGVGVRDALTLLGATIPHVVVLTIPMGFLFGVLIAMGRLNSDNELVALQAGGISHRRLLRPVLVVAVLLFGVNAWLTMLAMPEANRSLREMKARMYASGTSGAGGSGSAAFNGASPGSFTRVFPTACFTSLTSTRKRGSGVMSFCTTAVIPVRSG